MPSSAAEVARTLAGGRLAGRLSLPAVPEGMPVAHATTSDGAVLIAARRGSRAWLSLALSGDGAPAVLTVDDVPPFTESPALGQVSIDGSMYRVGDADLRSAGLRFVEANPLDDLLDIGDGVDLFRLDADEVRLTRGRLTFRLTAAEFAAATPDPLHVDELALLTDLRDHHAAEVSALVPGSPTGVLPVRLDRYGLWVALPRLARLEFPGPAHGPGCVARALRLRHARGHEARDAE